MLVIYYTNKIKFKRNLQRSKHIFAALTPDVVTNVENDRNLKFALQFVKMI